MTLTTTSLQAARPFVQPCFFDPTLDEQKPQLSVDIRENANYYYSPACYSTTTVKLDPSAPLGQPEYRTPPNSPGKLKKPSPRSRTMSFARQIVDPRPPLSISSGFSTSAVATVATATSTSTSTKWRPFKRTTSAQDNAALQQRPHAIQTLQRTGFHLASTSMPSTSKAVARPLPTKSEDSSAVVAPYVAIYDYFSHPTHSLLHPVSTIEHYWAMRAAVAEKLLEAHAAHKTELTAAAHAHEERRLRELADLDTRFTHIARMVWTILAAAALSILAALYLALRLSAPPPPAPSTGPMHFTIPVLSPFASVVEHETSAVNTPLVAVLLLAAGLALFLWLKCGCGRR
ncbi:uncharacterized protein BXZ73DRAFT_77022 [Epithele typhae]|uniref:uncharacterized protein n=1 Tax=Epithele typhae TaxID=378194 RepID=UPI0020076CBD|nr:uncharacterized protein BXZ73DRAFT_77022 [Epithele typhae]KAH9934546.1 hypothetical protein BXZ73DRAFT_77022 [Epithele typhae]